jgi:hypothetical protein
MCSSPLGVYVLFISNSKIMLVCRGDRKNYWQVKKAVFFTRQEDRSGRSVDLNHITPGSSGLCTQGPHWEFPGASAHPRNHGHGAGNHDDPAYNADGE